MSALRYGKWIRSRLRTHHPMERIMREKSGADSGRGQLRRWRIGVRGGHHEGIYRHLGFDV
jgi:hypothetical protein